MRLHHFYISIVSHGHDDFLIHNQDLITLSDREDVTVVVMDNLKSEKLDKHCSVHGFDYLSNESPNGFGANNNAVFQHCSETYSMKNQDYFIVMNPDIILQTTEFEKLVQFTTDQESELFTINLFLDKEFTEFDPSVRHFPTWLNYFKSFFLKLGYGYDKSTIQKPTIVDWASASFLAFKTSLFQNLNGFDEAFFMYCEDIDICARAKALGSECIYTPSIKAHHFVQQENRNIFSRHFWWHLKSIFRFFKKKKEGEYVGFN